jgi:hypothetical protein
VPQPTILQHALDDIVMYTKSSIEYDEKRGFGMIKKIPIGNANRKT